jgi:hypothetical protein
MKTELSELETNKNKKTNSLQWKKLEKRFLEIDKSKLLLRSPLTIQLLRVFHQNRGHIDSQQLKEQLFPPSSKISLIFEDNVNLKFSAFMRRSKIKLFKMGIVLHYSRISKTWGVCLKRKVYLQKPKKNWIVAK